MFDFWSLIVGFIVGAVACSLAFGWSEYRHREKMRRKVFDLEDELSQFARREALHRADAAHLRKVIAKATSAGVIQTEGRLGPPTPAKPKSKPKPVAVLPVGHQSARGGFSTGGSIPGSDFSTGGPR